MSRYLLAALAGVLTGLCSAPALAALDGGGSYLMQGFYTTPGVLPPTAGAIVRWVAGPASRRC